MVTKKNSTVVKAKKAPVMKKEISKTVSKKEAPLKKGDKKSLPVVVTGPLCFWVNNGPALCSMKDLSEAFRTISTDQFLHHTGMGRNDFSAWVRDVLGDKKCAAELLKAKTMKEALAVVEKHL